MKNSKKNTLQNFKKFEVKNSNEITGGAILRFTGFLDGIKGNTRLCFFC